MCVLCGVTRSILPQASSLLVDIGTGRDVFAINTEAGFHPTGSERFSATSCGGGIAQEVHGADYPARDVAAADFPARPQF